MKFHFEELPLDEFTGEEPDPLSSSVKELFGLSYLFPYQRLVIANIIEAASEINNNEESDRECMGKQIVILPTGAGKSLCFQLPAMLLEGATLVIYPILGLMSDQERRLEEKGFSPVTLRGGQTEEEREIIYNKILTGDSKFIIANPEVLLSPRVLPRLKELKIIHTVIDEAHCVSEWGESFRPSYLEISKIISMAGSPLVTAFTATAGNEVLEKIEKYIFGGSGAGRIVGNPDRKNIHYSARGCIIKNPAVRDILFKCERPAIVFCSARYAAEDLAFYLRDEMDQMGISWRKEIRYYHAGLSRTEKKNTEEWFFKSSDAVLTATCAYGLGIDKSNIRTVIHRDTPPSVEAYLQESGRAGRDGENSRAILLWGPEDEIKLKKIKNENDKKRFIKLLNYAGKINVCRRESLLRMLDYLDASNDTPMEIPSGFCCDVCDNKASLDLREVKSIVKFFRHNRLVYTRAEAAGVLSGAGSINFHANDAKEVISYLLDTGRLKISRNIFWKGRITV